MTGFPGYARRISIGSQCQQPRRRHNVTHLHTRLRSAGLREILHISARTTGGRQPEKRARKAGRPATTAQAARRSWV